MDKDVVAGLVRHIEALLARQLTDQQRLSFVETYADIAEEHYNEVEDWKTRNGSGQDRPPKSLRSARNQQAHRDGGGSPYNYGPDSGAGVPESEWDTHWKETFGRPRSAPGKSRVGGHPVKPLRSVLRSLRLWFKETLGYSFDPKTDDIALNPASEVFFEIAKSLDARYSISNIATAEREVRKSRSKKRD